MNDAFHDRPDNRSGDAFDDSLDDLLVAMDAAPASSITGVDRIRAQARLDQILAGAADEPIRTARRGRVRLRWIAGAAALVAAATIGVTALDTATMPDASYASWTPASSALGDAEIAALARACDVTDADVLLAERRGEWVALIGDTGSGADEVTNFCLGHQPTSSSDVDDASWGAASGSGGPGSVAAPADGFVEGASTGPTVGSAGPDDYSMVEGSVGGDVRAVTIRTVDGDAVEATVADGRFVAWWPGPMFADALEKGPITVVTYDLTLADGTVVRDAKPAGPQ